MEVEKVILEDSYTPDSDSTDWSADAEVSVIEYARYHGLTQDFMAVDILAPENMHVPSILTTLELNVPGLPSLGVFKDIQLNEKLLIDSQSALFLKQVMTIEESPELEQSPRLSQRKRLKAELPLLPTDPDLDQRLFDRSQNVRKMRDTSTIPCSACWPEDDKPQLYWPSPDLPSAIMAQIKGEKLQLDKDDILFLQQCISVLEEPDVEDVNTTERKKRQKEHEAARQTSPLLPVSSPFILGVPDSPVSRMPIATSPIDPAVTALTKLEESMDMDDTFSLGTLSELSDFDTSTSYTPFTNSPLKRKRIDDIKVEVPLESAIQSSSPCKKLKSVSFSDQLLTTIPDYARPFSSGGSPAAEKRYNESFESFVRPSAELAVRSLENEQLIEEDSTMRAEVPLINQKGPLAPWEVFNRKQLGCKTELEAQRHLISMLKRELVKPYEIWPSVARVNKAITRWQPFDMRLRDIPGEEIEAEYLDQFKPSLPDDTTSGWKPDGLRTLDVQDDGDDEIDCAEITLPLEKTSLLAVESKSGNPKFAEDPKSALYLQSGVIVSVESNIPGQSQEIARLQDAPLDKVDQPQSFLGGAFSASSSLDRYMQVHTGTATSNKAIQPKQPLEENSKVAFSEPTSTRPPGAGEKKEGTEPTPQAPLHPPALPSTLPPRCFVLSSTMFERRSLIREIERLIPAAKSIEREFSSRQALCGSITQNAEQDEADIILAPGCGLLLTTLQKVKQRSLPGEIDRNIVRERVLRLARRYERLVVMVNEGQKVQPGALSGGSTIRPLDNHDCSELSSLINFSAAQSHDIQVLYVPGDEAFLATWIVSCMVRFGLDDPDLHLVQDETFWELFLRKAGMDTFAAQAVLAKLKRPDPMPPCSDAKNYGLAAFIMMGETERLRRFAGLLGGEKILRKVSMAIDGSWTTAPGCKGAPTTLPC